jgi:dihydrofolate synthase/folylpolyglutamate synthase
MTLQPVIEHMKTLSVGEPSYFEILLAIAFLAFAQKHVDIAIVEVGIEGRYDATTVLSPLAFILTNISLDHTKILGETVEAIAEEATAIIQNYALRIVHEGKKPLIVTGVTQPSVVRIVEERSHKAGVRILRLGKDFHYTLLHEDTTGERFAFSGLKDIADLSVSLRGSYQAANASLAIEAAIVLEDFGFPVSEEQIRKALATAFFPGRFETISVRSSQFSVQRDNFPKEQGTKNQLLVILDGAHNQAKMEAFIEALMRNYPQQHFVFLLGFKQDKDVFSMLRGIAPIAKAIIITSYTQATDMSKQTAMAPEEIKQLLINIGTTVPSVTVVPEINNALATAEDKSIEGDCSLVVTGSLYLVGEIRSLLTQQGAMQQG